MKKIIICIILLAALAATLGIGAAATYFGSGVQVVASEVSLIKTGLIGQNLTFSDSDFKKALGFDEFDKITITEIPSSSEGTLMLGERRVGEGQSIRRRNLEKLTFIPIGNETTESSFKFCIDGASGTETVCTMKFIDRVNYAPKLNTDIAESLSVTTQKGISVYGRMSASDPEGDTLEYIIVSYPKKGTLEVTDKETGEFKYTPKKSYDGKDSFVFVVRDEYGNYTKAESVSISITERMSEVVYIDMENSKSYNAAVAMTAMGIMSGTRIGDDMYFSPEEGVSRAEFVAMAMKALGIKADTTLTATYFDDNSEIPASLISYIATAARCGIVNGAFDGQALNFRPNDHITRYEAAIVMSNLLDIKADSAVFSKIEGIKTVPVWARAHVGAMYSIGIFQDGEDMSEKMNRESVAEALYRLAKRH